MPQDEKAAKEDEAKAPETEVAEKAPEKPPAEKKPRRARKAKRGPGRPKGSGKKRGPGRPKGSGKKAAAPTKGRRGRPKSAAKAARDAFASGIHRFGAIAKAVFQATGQKIRFPAISKALAGLRGKSAPKAKGRRGPGRPRGARRGRKPGRPKSVAAAGAAFLLDLPGLGKGLVKAGSIAEVKSRLAAFLAKGGEPTKAALYARREVKFERLLRIRL